ncbi:MAG TPA: PIN domain-containing protein [Thermoplasmata archaeon]|nr:PIN domain-containing protein [Thermoplasmata archaeon]
MRRTLLANPKLFACALESLHEIWEHRDEWNLRGLRTRDLTAMLRYLVREVLDVPRAPQAREQVDSTAASLRDPDDAPVAALALALQGDGLWTFNPRDFAGFSAARGIPVLTTAEVVRLLRRL